MTKSKVHDHIVSQCRRRAPYKYYLIWRGPNASSNVWDFMRILPGNVYSVDFSCVTYFPIFRMLPLSPTTLTNVRSSLRHASSTGCSNQRMLFIANTLQLCHILSSRKEIHKRDSSVFPPKKIKLHYNMTHLHFAQKHHQNAWIFDTSCSHLLALPPDFWWVLLHVKCPKQPLPPWRHSQYHLVNPHPRIFWCDQPKASWWLSLPPI